MSKPFVAILMGSESDLSIMQAGADILKQLEIDYEIKITSAHRTPAVTQHYISDAEARGCQVFIAGAGLAAHLAGATAAHTTCLLYTSPSPRDLSTSRMPSSA